MRARTQQLWEESMELIRDNNQAMADANKKVLELWAGMLKKEYQSDKGKIRCSRSEISNLESTICRR
jgi:hypothetical protein